jgi:hypothetical protein
MIMQTSIIVIRRENPVLKNTPVESSLVKTGKKLSRAQLVGDFSMIPTNAIDHIGLIGSVNLRGIKIPTGTKSAKKGWRVIAKW